MAETHAVSALKKKRAEIAGLLLDCDERRAALREALATIDAALKIFAFDGDPAEIKPKKRQWELFRRGELKRAVIAILRDADGPLTSSDIAEIIVRQRDWNVNDTALVDKIADSIRSVRQRLPEVLKPPVARRSCQTNSA